MSVVNIFGSEAPANTDVSDPSQYTFGTRFTCSGSGAEVVGVRVYRGTVSMTFSTVALWNITGTLLASKSVTPSGTGWLEFLFDSPVAIDAATPYVAGYLLTSSGRYGVTSQRFSSDVVNGILTGTADGETTATNNGRFNTGGTLTFPGDEFNKSWYGVDVMVEDNAGQDEVATGAGIATAYGTATVSLQAMPASGAGIAAGVGTGAGTQSSNAPTITGVQLTASGLTVTATISATDNESLSGATYFIEWGDGDTDSSATNVFQHTYATGGLKAILARVTDSTGLSDHHAAAIRLVEPGDGLGIRDILDTIVSYVLASGYFDSVNQYEPAQVPGHGLHSAVWVDSIMPLAKHSGLTLTTTRVEINQCIYSSMEQEPPEDIESVMAEIVDAMIATYSGDIQLGGNVKCIDLLGMAGQPLGAQAGYINTPGYANRTGARNQVGTDVRVMNITIPVIVNDVWAHAA